MAFVLDWILRCRGNSRNGFNAFNGLNLNAALQTAPPGSRKGTAQNRPGGASAHDSAQTRQQARRQCPERGPERAVGRGPLDGGTGWKAHWRE